MGMVDIVKEIASLIEPSSYFDMQYILYVFFVFQE